MNDIYMFLLAVLSLFTAIYAIGQTNKSIEFNQYQIILNMYSELKDLERDLVMYQADSKDENYDLYVFTQESICNHYEIYCAHYLRSSINKDLFKDLFKENIIKTVDHPNYESFFFPKVKDKYNYCKVKEVYKEFGGTK